MKDFKKITKEIKSAILELGYGVIKPIGNDTFIMNYIENNNSYQMSVSMIEIDYDIITLSDIVGFNLHFEDLSIDNQIELYEFIYNNRDQLDYYELEDKDFLCRKVIDEEGDVCLWRILDYDEARHILYNGKGELFALYDDGSEGAIDDENRLKECIEYGEAIGIKV